MFTVGAPKSAMSSKSIYNIKSNNKHMPTAIKLVDYNCHQIANNAISVPPS